MDEGTIIDWNRTDPWCRVCGDRQFTVLDAEISNSHGEIRVCDRCRMGYLIMNQYPENIAKLLGFMDLKSYFNMLISGKIELKVDPELTQDPGKN